MMVLVLGLPSWEANLKAAQYTEDGSLCVYQPTTFGLSPDFSFVGSALHLNVTLIGGVHQKIAEPMDMGARWTPEYLLVTCIWALNFLTSAYTKHSDRDRSMWPHVLTWLDFAAQRISQGQNASWQECLWRGPSSDVPEFFTEMEKPVSAELAAFEERDRGIEESGDPLLQRYVETKDFDEFTEEEQDMLSQKLEQLDLTDPYSVTSELSEGELLDQSDPVATRCITMAKGVLHQRTLFKLVMPMKEKCENMFHYQTEHGKLTASAEPPLTLFGICRADVQFRDIVTMI